jgi:dTDP-4-amino-4,6-dideoxygalactose transaminase
VKPFAGNGGRASELIGAMLNVQLDRINDIIAAMRAEKKRIVQATARLANLGLAFSPMNSPDHDCATRIMYLLPSDETATRFTEVFPSVIADKIGRHTYTEWDQVLMWMGAAHPAMNLYNHLDNAGCQRSYSKEMCTRPLDILNRTVMAPIHPDHSETEIDAIIHNIEMARRVMLGGISAEGTRILPTSAVDSQKFDMPTASRSDQKRVAQALHFRRNAKPL